MMFGDHILKNVFLLYLSLLALPATTFLTVTLAIYSRLRPSTHVLARREILSSPSFRPKTVLVTGVGMTKGLTLARVLYLAGHKVIGADFVSHGVCGSGSVSSSLVEFYKLHAPDTSNDRGTQLYVENLLEIIVKEKVDLWVSCSGVASAVEDGFAKEVIEQVTQCKAVQFNIETTEKLHEKGNFMKFVRDLGLPVPETKGVVSQEDVLNELKDFGLEGGKKFILKPVGMDDANRGDLTLLPKETESDTREHLQRLIISEEKPWILQRFIEGKEYCTHALVVKGTVKAFVACPSSELLMHYQALPEDGVLWRKMLDFTEKVAEAEGDDFTGHLSFDFIVEGGQNGDFIAFPIECNPRAHTAVVLFNGTLELAKAYISLLDEEKPISKAGGYVKPKFRTRYYWIGHDLVDFVSHLLSSFQGRCSPGELAANMLSFIEHLLFWRDGAFATWDPAPWWWLYQVYWPMQFLGSLRSGKRWSRINVSTNKMFEC